MKRGAVETWKRGDVEMRKDVWSDGRWTMDDGVVGSNKTGQIITII